MSVGAGVSSAMHSSHGPWHNLFLHLALMCEKLGHDEGVLLYVTAALETDHKQAGCNTPMTRSIALMLRARIQAVRGNLADAARDFENAAALMNQAQVWLLEAYALRDLKLCVLDAMDHSEHGSRRLGAVLRRLGPRWHQEGPS